MTEDTKIEEIQFITGSKYEGTWNATDIHGTGKYTSPSGVVFEGEFRDGMFHGQGILKWPCGRRINGIWSYGRLQNWQYIFRDGLTFRETNWDYCIFPDRRFYESIVNGLRPAGETLTTNLQRTIIFPPFCFDTGNGIFDPNTDCSTSYCHPKKDKCEKEWPESIGFQPRLYENWFNREELPQLPYILPLSNDSPENWWKRITSFERHQSETDNSNRNTCCCIRFSFLGVKSEKEQERSKKEKMST